MRATNDDDVRVNQKEGNGSIHMVLALSDKYDFTSEILHHREHRGSRCKVGANLPRPIHTTISELAGWHLWN